VKLYGSEDYDCVILGDGKTQHWGIDFDEYAPANIAIKCSPTGDGQDQKLGR